MTHLQEIFRIAPANNDHQAAIRCAVGLGAPLLLLLFTGRIDLAIFATFGAFTGIYGRNEPHRQRLGHQGRAGALMLAVILAAALCARLDLDDWGTVVGTTAVAGLGTIATGFWRLRPVGSLFHIFAFAAISSVPNQPPLWEGMLTAVLTVGFSLLLGLSGMLVRKYRTEWARHERPRFSRVQRRLIYIDGLQYATAAVLAGSIATLLGIGHNYWAMVAATVPLVGATVRHRVHRGLQRILGTFGGLLLTALILFPGLEPWQMVLVIAACQFGAEMFIARQYALAQVVVTPLALVSTELAHPSDPLELLRDRGLETLIGAAVGMAVVVAVHLRQQHLREKHARRKQDQVGQLR
ncbi:MULTISPECIES: FUSC family protein [unclassified Arthrobacter]|uniref:FUSC family protein n=1 Tax=unclassified Arthrobacter TaxID=235627 RepID=UPI001E38C56C|nr:MULTISPECIES: FUSC family protein [unclassified Arthrobacter]MCC9146761.1 FUSC family protein [Arthrobacter sp. zg-Y919]MDK1277992.1 FUSC family protein [Arthrobacter sp. zg.Y919]WIB03417.1 FUSC family protein [Arthrobacter sp. zg-Y919]